MKQARCTKYRTFFMGHAFAITTTPFSRDPSNSAFSISLGSDKGGERDQDKPAEQVALPVSVRFSSYYVRF